MTTFTNIAKSSSTFSGQPKSGAATTFLLLQDGFKLLLQNGGGILLTVGSAYSNQSKSASSFTNQSKS